MRSRHGTGRMLGLLALVCMAALSAASCGSATSESEMAVTTPTPEPSATVALSSSPTSTPQPEITIAVLSPLATATQPPPVPSPTPVTLQPSSTATEVPEASASPTATPEPSATATYTPSATATHTPTPAAEVRSFTVAPREVRNVGGHVQVAWQAVGERAELCSTNCFGPTGCQQVPLTGQRTVVSDQALLSTNGFALRVSVGNQSVVESRSVRFLCNNLRTWFMEPPPPYCPAGEALTSYAAGQGFERGFMVWIEDTDEFYVFDSVPDPSGWLIYHSTVGLVLKPGASEQNRVGEDPPPGLYEPVSGFGLIWRGEVEWPEVGNVRERLGWATEPEFGFDTAFQYAILACPRGWAAYMRAPHGQILRLSPASTAGWPLIWEEVQP